MVFLVVIEEFTLDSMCTISCCKGTIIMIPMIGSFSLFPYDPDHSIHNDATKSTSLSVIWGKPNTSKGEPSTMRGGL